MKSDDKFWLGLWGICGAVVISVFVSTHSYFNHKNEIIAEMAKSGRDPVEISCLIEGNASATACVILAAKKEVK